MITGGYARVTMVDRPVQLRLPVEVNWRRRTCSTRDG